MRLEEIEQRLCDIAASELGIPRIQVDPSSRIIEDLRCDSLDLLELIRAIEDDFGVHIPEKSSHPVFKALFTRNPFRLKDLGEAIHILLRVPQHQPNGTAHSQKKRFGVPHQVPFTQLGGVWNEPGTVRESLRFEKLPGQGSVAVYRRNSDGMRCAQFPSGIAIIGGDDPEAEPDEGPVHPVPLTSFLIDMEPVSVLAYCRFLNSSKSGPETWADWFLQDEGDKRKPFLPIHLVENHWVPLEGTELFPMVLVTWFGANAYSLWANGVDPLLYRTHDGFLPSEAQWEYGAKGPIGGNGPATPCSPGVFELHQRGARYSDAAQLPLSPVHEPVGVSVFGLHHMSGNIWQWCQDWYDPNFYKSLESREPNAVNRNFTGIKSERGGSWVGPQHLCRSTHRRGRRPDAMGRCLGFRCVSILGQTHQA